MCGEPSIAPLRAGGRCGNAEAAKKWESEYLMAAGLISAEFPTFQADGRMVAQECCGD